MEKQIKLTVEQALQLYKTNPEYRNTLLSVFTDQELEITPSYPKKFEDLKQVGGYFKTTDNKIRKASLVYDSNSYNSLDLFVTEKQVKSVLAFAQLSQLAKAMNGDWIPDWSNILQNKYIVNRSKNSLKITNWNTTFQHIYFETKEKTEFSLKYHEQLWKDYYELD